MKLRKKMFIVLIAAALSANLFLGIDTASAAVCTNPSDQGRSCSIGDGHSTENGTCINYACVLSGTNVTTPSPVGSPGGITSTKIPGTTTEGSGIIKCGRPGQDMCTLCDLISGMNYIIQYLMKIAIGVALLAMAIGGVMYIVSAGGSELIGQAKSTMKNAAIGFVIIFAAFLIIDTTINYIGIKQGMGINVTSWGQFDCNRSVPVSN